jgi:peptide-methionine (S)-S-oxide reductase
VGYAGGRMQNPDYSNLGDHTETVQLDFDPQRITYSRLLELFWDSHDPTDRTWSRQYMNAIFFHNERQREAAMASLAALEKKSGVKVRSEVLPLRTFYAAEDYHQKYVLKRRSDLVLEMSRIYPREKDFVDSTAVARLNGYVGGNGSAEQLAREIERLGLSPKGRQILTDLVDSKGGGWFN